MERRLLFLSFGPSEMVIDLPNTSDDHTDWLVSHAKLTQSFPVPCDGDGPDRKGLLLPKVDDAIAIIPSLEAQPRPEAAAWHAIVPNKCETTLKTFHGKGSLKWRKRCNDATTSKRDYEDSSGRWWCSQRTGILRDVMMPRFSGEKNTNSAAAICSIRPHTFSMSLKMSGYLLWPLPRS